MREDDKTTKAEEYEKIDPTKFIIQLPAIFTKDCVTNNMLSIWHSEYEPNEQSFEKENISAKFRLWEDGPGKITLNDPSIFLTDPECTKQFELVMKWKYLDFCPKDLSDNNEIDES